MALHAAGSSGPQALQVALTSSRGDRFEGKLAGTCIDAEISQHTRFENRIAITVADRDGRVLGRAETHDLANRPFTIALDGGGEIVVTPGGRCQRS